MQTCWHMRVGWCVRFMPVPVSVHLCMHVCMLACTHALINSWACTPLNTRNNPQVPHGVWTHIAASYDRVGGSRLFVNGSLVDYRAARGSGNAGADGGVDSHIDNTFPNRFSVGAYLDDRGGGGGGRGGGDWRGGTLGGGAGQAGARVYRGGVDELRWWEGPRSEVELKETLWERLSGIGTL